MGRDLTDLILQRGREDTARALIEAAEEAGPFRLKAISMRAFCAKVPEITDSDDLLGPLLRRGQRVMIASPKTGQGKTTLAYQMVSAAIQGEEFLSWRGRNGGLKALIVDIEQPGQSTKIRALETGLADREDVSIFHSPEGLLLDKNAEHRRALEELLSTGWDIVLVDPFYKLRAGEPKEEEEAATLMNFLDRMRMEQHFCLVLPIHSRKGQPGSRFSMDDIFGWGIYQRNAEIIVGIERVADGYSRLHWWKDRDGRLQVPMDATWGLTYDHEHLFRRDPDDEKDEPTVTERVLEVLRDSGQVPMTVEGLEEATGAARSTVAKAVSQLVKVGRVELAGKDGQRKLWRLTTEGDNELL